LLPFIQSRQRRYKISVALAAVAAIMGGASFLARSGQFSFIANPTEVYEYSMQRADAGLGRLQALGYVHDTIGKNVVTSVVGYGPGAITPTRFLARGVRSELYKNNDLLSNYNDYAYVTLELGYGGLLLILYLLYRLFIFNQKFQMRCNDPFWRAISLGLAGIIFTSVYATLYTRGWTQPSLAFSLWFLAGAITRVAYLKGLLTNPNTPSTRGMSVWRP
jgi:cell division protein FtsW (lipid II flippase)